MINLGSIFVKSPFKPLREHMGLALESVTPLGAFMRALHDDDYESLKKLKKQVHTAEGNADDIKNNIRNHLPHSLFLPIDRRDLLAVLDMQDSIADTAQDIVDLLELRKMKLPQEMREDLLGYIAINEKACTLGFEVSKNFEALVESGFGKHHAEKLRTMIEEVGNVESEADEVEAQLTRTLFKMESSLNPVDVIFWYRIFEQIGDLADYTEKMANRLRLLIAK